MYIECIEFTMRKLTNDRLQYPIITDQYQHGQYCTMYTSISVVYEATMAVTRSTIGTVCLVLVKNISRHFVVIWKTFLIIDYTCQLLTMQSLYLRYTASSIFFF